MRTIKIITHVDRINWFLHKWLDYHRSIFPDEVFHFIIDENFIDANALSDFLISKGFEASKINIVQFNNLPNEYDARLEYSTLFVNNLQKELLTNFDVVIYLDIDELLYHEDILNVLNSFSSNFLTTNVIDVTHNMSKEPSFDFNKSVFSQRNYMNTSPTAGWYKKPIITRIPVNWGHGKHTIDRIGFDPSPENIYIIHLGKIDFEFSNLLAKENIKMRGRYESQNTFEDDALSAYISAMTLSKIPEHFLLLQI